MKKIYHMSIGSKGNDIIFRLIFLLIMSSYDDLPFSWVQLVLSLMLFLLDLLDVISAVPSSLHVLSIYVLFPLPKY